MSGDAAPHYSGGSNEMLSIVGTRLVFLREDGAGNVSNLAILAAELNTVDHDMLWVGNDRMIPSSLIGGPQLFHDDFVTLSMNLDQRLVGVRVAYPQHELDVSGTVATTELRAEGVSTGTLTAGSLATGAVTAGTLASNSLSTGTVDAAGLSTAALAVSSFTLAGAVPGSGVILAYDSGASTLRVAYLSDGSVVETATGLGGGGGGAATRTIEAGRVLAAGAPLGAGTVPYTAFSTVAPELVTQPLGCDTASYLPLLAVEPGSSSFAFSTTALWYATGELSTAPYAFSWVAVGPPPS